MTDNTKQVLGRLTLVVIIVAAFIIIPVPLNRVTLNVKYPYLIVEWFASSLIICLAGLMVAMAVIGITQIIDYIKYGD